MLLEQVAERGSLRLRAAARYRLAHPPTPVGDLPNALRLVAGAMGSAAFTAATTVKHRPRFVRTLVGVNTAVFVGMLMAGGGDRLATLMQLGALPSPTLGEATWWRFGASMFLHVDIVHLGMNMIGLAVFGGALERRFGLWRVLPLYLAAGLVGNLLWWSIASWRGVDEFAVGASGCIMGLVGAMAVTLVREWRAGGSAIGARFIILQIVLQWVFDASHPNVAASAHFGGLVAGALLALGLFPRPNRAAQR
jgi:rhomboid protease GluP